MLFLLTPTFLIFRVKSLSLTNASSLFFLRGVHIIHPSIYIHPSICTHPSTHPSITHPSRKQNLSGHLNNTLWYLYIHLMPFHDSGLFWVWILTSSLDLSTFHYTSHVDLVNTHAPRPSSDCCFHPLPLLSPLYTIWFLTLLPVPHSIWNFPACVVIIYVLLVP